MITAYFFGSECRPGEGTDGTQARIDLVGSGILRTSGCLRQPCAIAHAHIHASLQVVELRQQLVCQTRADWLPGHGRRFVLLLHTGSPQSIGHIYMSSNAHHKGSRIPRGIGNCRY